MKPIYERRRRVEQGCLISRSHGAGHQTHVSFSRLTSVEHNQSREVGTINYVSIGTDRQLALVRQSTSNDCEGETAMTKVLHRATAMVGAMIARLVFVTTSLAQMPTSPWKKGAPFPEPDEELYGVATNGKLYVFGGWDGGRLVASPTSTTRSPTSGPRRRPCPGPRTMPPWPPRTARAT